jgi:hypothetical protein
MGSFVYRAFKALREEKAAGGSAVAVDSTTAHLEEEAVTR